MLDDSTNQSEPNDDSDAMDETMNILCSMDTTISNPVQSQATVNKQRKKEQALLEQFDEDLQTIVDKFDEEDRSEWLREQLADLWKHKLSSIIK